MRNDEEIVIRAVAKFYSARSWRVGEDPPDAYVDLGGTTIAVEISTLTQHVTTQRGTRARLSDDQVAVRLANDLDQELRDTIPQGMTVCLHLSSPINQPRRTKRQISERVRQLIEHAAPEGTEWKYNVLGNQVELWLTRHGNGQHKKIVAIIDNQHSTVTF